MESKVSFLCSQEPTISPYLEPDETSQHPPSFLPKVSFTGQTGNTNWTFLANTPTSYTKCLYILFALTVINKLFSGQFNISSVERLILTVTAV
jgi:hypothetical protein